LNGKNPESWFHSSLLQMSLTWSFRRKPESRII